MKTKIIMWLADCLWSALGVVSIRLHDYIFDPEWHAKIRFAHRERWWKYKCKAETTKNPRDDRRAQCWAIQYDFKTPPIAALDRGDLDPHARDIAMKAVEEARGKTRGTHQP